jgi:hypothetical protein
MDPKYLQDLMRAVNAQRRKGVSLAKLDQWVREVTRARGQELGWDQLFQLARSGALNEPPTTPVTTTDLLRGGAMGATAGLASWLAESGISGPVNVPGAPGARGPMLERVQEFRSAHPAAAMASEITGASLPGAMAGPVAAGRGILPKIGSGITTGAAYGALAGAGEARGLAEVPERMFAGAGVGAAAGGTIGTVAAGLTELIPAFTRAIWGRVAPKVAGTVAGRAAVSEALERAGMRPEDITSGVRQLESVRPGMGTIADLDETMRRLTRSAVTEASGPIEGAVQQVRGRVMGAGERLAEDVRQLTGFRAPAPVARETAEARLASRGRELFRPIEEAYPRLPDDPRIADFLKNPDVAAIWGRVRPRTKKDLPISFAHVQALRQRLVGARGAALKSGDPALAQLYKDSRRYLDDVLDEIIPEFRAANQGYARTATTVKAFGMGAKAFTRSLPGDAVERELTQLAKDAAEESPRALEAYRHGMVDELVNRLLKAPRGRDVGGQMLSLGPSQRTALRAAFGTPDAFEQFMERAAVEGKFSALKNLMLQQSQTAEKGVDLLRSARTSGFWGPKAALLNLLANPNSALARARANEILRLTLTPAAETAGEVAGLAQPSIWDAVVRGAVGGAETGAAQQAPRLQGLLAPYLNP